MNLRFLRVTLGVWRGGLAAAIWLIVLALTALGAAPMAENLPPTEPERVRIGVLAYRGAEETRRQWDAMAVYLTREVRGYWFQIVPLDFSAVDLAVGGQEVDFILTNPANYVQLEARYGATRLATLKTRLGDRTTRRFGAVIFTRAGSAIESLKDLRGKKFLAAAPNSFGGWWMAWRELAAQKIDVKHDLTLNFAGTQDQVVLDVRDGKADAGTVRTGLLEDMAAGGKIKLADFRLLNEQKEDPDFPYLYSTRLYPEWPMAALKRTPETLAEAVAVALLKMPADGPEAMASQTAGFTVPLDYTPVHELLRDLRLAPYQDYGRVTVAQAMMQHWHWAVGGGAVLLVLVFVLVHILRLDRNQRRMRRQLEKELQQRRKADEVLAEERNLLRTLIDNLPDFVYVKDTQSRFVITNRTLANFLGLPSPDVFIGKTDFDFFPPEYARSFFEDERVVLRTGQPQISREELAVDRHGQRHWLTSSKVPLYDQKGNVVGLVGVGRDITKRKHAEDLLREANEQLAHSRQELLETVEALRRSNEELKTAQLQLIQAEKMYSVGTLAAGVAHEVKNPLQTILVGMDYLATQLPETPDAQMVFGEIRHAVERADTITRGLLDFAATRQLNLQPHDLNQVIESALRLTRHQLTSAHIRLEMRLDPNLPPVRLDKQKIEQVFVNLFENAVHAMGDHGSLTIITRTMLLADGTPRDEGSRRSERLRQGDAVVIAEILDTGGGIPEENLARIFDPFFTTKPTGKGTGLGLAVARKILDLHGGSIEVRNCGPDEERGVRVTVMFKAQGRAQ